MGMGVLRWGSRCGGAVADGGVAEKRYLSGKWRRLAWAPLRARGFSGPLHRIDTE